MGLALWTVLDSERLGSLSMLNVFHTDHFDFVIESSISKNGAGKKRGTGMEALSTDIEPSSRETIQLFELSMNYAFCLLYTLQN